MRLQHRFEELGGYVLEDRIAAILQGLGIPHRQEARLTELSGGERVKVALAKILAADADLLLLDEPTNHLDLNSIRWLENYLQNTKNRFWSFLMIGNFSIKSPQKHGNWKKVH